MSSLNTKESPLERYFKEKVPSCLRQSSLNQTCSKISIGGLNDMQIVMLFMILPSFWLFVTLPFSGDDCKRINPPTHHKPQVSPKTSQANANIQTSNNTSTNTNPTKKERIVLTPLSVKVEDVKTEFKPDIKARKPTDTLKPVAPVNSPFKVKEVPGTPSTDDGAIKLKPSF